jgi:hypothetical protein
VIRHFWGAELLYAQPDPGQDMRHVGTLEPLWNMFDLIPEGPRHWLGRATGLLVLLSRVSIPDLGMTSACLGHQPNR